jgi:inhibitor of apoptosis domain-containing protein
MEVLQARIDSFKKSRRIKNPNKQSSTVTVRWPHPLTFKANPETLGAAGFFYNPSYEGPDSVTCYFCDKELGRRMTILTPFIGKNVAKHVAGQVFDVACGMIWINQAGKSRI